MKKFLIVLLICMSIILTFSMASCGKDDQPKDPEPPETPTDPVEDPADREAADAFLERVAKIGDVTKSNYASLKLKITNARKSYDKLTDAQRALVTEEEYAKLTEAEEAYARFLLEAQKEAEAKELAEQLTVAKLGLATPAVDGTAEGNYFLSKNFVLNKAIVGAFDDQQIAVGAGTSDQAKMQAADASVSVRMLLDDEKVYICLQSNTEDVKTVLYYTLNAEQVSGLVLENGTVSLFAKDVASASEKDYDGKSAKVDSIYTYEVAVPLSDLGLEKSNFVRNKVGFTFSVTDGDYDMRLPGVGVWNHCERFYTEDATHFNYVSYGTPAMDCDVTGKIGDLFAASSGMTLSQDACNEYIARGIKSDLILVGDTSMVDSGDMYSTFRFAVGDTYLYICEERGDQYRVYSAPMYNQPYCGDGTLLWFTCGGKQVSGIQWNRGTVESKTADGDYLPEFGLFFDDNTKMSDNVKLDNEEIQCKLWTDDSQYNYIMQIRVPLADLKLSIEDFRNGNVGFTFCTVDIINPDCDATTAFQWEGNGYQMQYPGVNYWLGRTDVEPYTLVVK